MTLPHALTEGAVLPELSRFQRTLLMYCLADIKGTDEVFKPVPFDFQELFEINGYSSKTNYAYASTQLADLKTKEITIHQKGKEGVFRRKMTCTLIPTIWIEEDVRTGQVIRGAIRLNRDLEPLLLKLKEQSQYYTKIELKKALLLRDSGTAFRLYLLLVQWKNSYKQELTYDLGELRKLLGYKHEYGEYRAFKRRVLSPAITAIKEKAADLLELEHEEIKEGRKVKGIRFILDRRKRDANREAARNKREAQGEQTLEKSVKNMNKKRPQNPARKTKFTRSKKKEKEGKKKTNEDARQEAIKAGIPYYNDPDTGEIISV